MVKKDKKNHQGEGGGRPSIFKKEFINEMMEYFNIDSNFLQEIVITGKNEYSKTEYKEFANNLPTIQGFCRKIGIDRQTLYNWLKDGEHGEKIILDDGSEKTQYDDNKVKFLGTYKKCKEIQEQIRIENSLKGLYNPAFAIFLGKNVFDRKDKTETALTGANGKDLFPELTPEQIKNIGNEMIKNTASK